MNEAKVYDARFHHPFTCIISGPTGSGKSTFVYNVLKNKDRLIDTDFDYILIIVGTDAAANPTLSKLTLLYPDIVKIFELRKSFADEKSLCKEFPPFLTDYIDKQKGKNGCIIFDDVMTEMAECGNVLINLFSKYSSHSRISSIFITQNLFLRVGGSGGDNFTLYRNTHVLVLFKYPMDNTIISVIARRLNPKRYKDMLKMLTDITENYRYVVIHGNFNTPEELRFASDLFAEDPMPHQKIFSLQQRHERGFGSA